ncbi:hypothetical protein N185_15965 [Sinorhizobium sp. GW3]|nr:hypothetical protein N185_15965 [Sinorhizobium sp. GW3]
MKNINPLKRTLDELLKDYGFKPKGNSWYFRAEETISIVNLQKSQYGDQYYVNFAVVFRALMGDEFPKERHGHIRFRLDDVISQDLSGQLSDVLDLESQLTEQARRELFAGIVRPALEILARCESPIEIAHALKDRQLREWWCTVAALDFLQPYLK